jgi:hypothetical protein
MHSRCWSLALLTHAVSIKRGSNQTRALNLPPKKPMTCWRSPLVGLLASPLPLPCNPPLSKKDIGHPNRDLNYFKHAVSFCSSIAAQFSDQYFTWTLYSIWFPLSCLYLGTIRTYSSSQALQRNSLRPTPAPTNDP